MILLTDIKGNKQKVNIKAQKQSVDYKNLPGVYVTIQDISKNTKEADLKLWSKQRKQSVRFLG